jgi:hypothetical protein
MNKKRNTLRIAFLLLVLCMISTVMLSGTFAKYTDTYAGQDTALVARWQFEAKEGETLLGDANKQLDLFGHLYNTNMNQKAGEDYIIAPGVSDEFTIAMSFLSDVDAKVTVDFNKEGSTVNDAVYNLPIEYSVDEGASWVTLAELDKQFVSVLKKVYGSNVLGDVSSANAFTFLNSDDETTATTISQTVKWRWAFNDNDTAQSIIDTAFGNASAESDGRLQYILNVNIKAEQIEPTTEPKNSD